MAVLDYPITSISVSINGSGTVLSIYETTGIYDEIANPNGWGNTDFPSLDIDCADVASITVVDPLGEETVYDVSSDWPDTTGLIPKYHYIIETGETEPSQLADGIYTIYYNVSSTGAGACDPDSLNVGTSTVFVYTALKCCVNQKRANFDIDCNCDWSEFRKMIELEVLYQSFLDAACCGVMSKAQELYDATLKMCTSSNCISC